MQGSRPPSHNSVLPVQTLLTHPLSDPPYYPTPSFLDVLCPVLLWVEEVLGINIIVIPQRKTMIDNEQACLLRSPKHLVGVEREAISKVNLVDTDGTADQGV